MVLHETARKEDARCMALLELARLELTGKTRDDRLAASEWLVRRLTMQSKD